MFTSKLLQEGVSVFAIMVMDMGLGIKPERLVKAIRSLRGNPRPTGSIKLDRNLYRMREGQYRIIYGIVDDDVVIVVCKVARRTESTYRDLPGLLDRALNELLED
jgi:mRNA-degrading endonuclease RelE of RelBE toxin-antitoxin system